MLFPFLARVLNIPVRRWKFFLNPGGLSFPGVAVPFFGDDPERTPDEFRLSTPEKLERAPSVAASLATARRDVPKLQAERPGHAAPESGRSKTRIAPADPLRPAQPDRG